MFKETLLVATWGNPSNWALAKYVIGEVKNGAESFNSTGSLVKVFDPSRTLILGLDTLFAERGRPGSYSEAKTFSHEYLRGYLCGLQARIHVLPGIITLKRSKIRVTGDPQDYYQLVLYTLLKELQTGPKPPDRLILDITHGINFMPALTMKASLEATAYASLARVLLGESPARVEVYNSDPYIPSSSDPCKRDKENPCLPAGKCSPIELNVHKILSQTAGTPEILEAIDRIFASWRENQAQKILKPRAEDLAHKVSQYNRNHENLNLLREAFILLKLFRYGLVPELLAYNRKNNDLRERLEETIKATLRFWEEGISVRESHGWLIIERKIRLWNGFELLVNALGLARALEPFSRDPPSIASAVKMKDAYKRLRSTVTARVQERELSKIDAALKSLKGFGNVMSLRDLYKRAGYVGYDDISDCEVFLRDIVAHGGWHTRIIVIEPKGEDILVRLNDRGVCRKDGETRDLWEVLDAL